jgi:hypothetical protein
MGGEKRCVLRLVMDGWLHRNGRHMMEWTLSISCTQVVLNQVKIFYIVGA